MALYDIVIYGASGYTGQYIVEYLMKNLNDTEKYGKLSWAIAGRDETKLKKVLEAKNAPTDIAVIICDSKDPESLLSMAKSTRLVLNCVGPYRFFGESVVKACVEAGTHHVDISGEPQYLEKIQLKYHSEAEEKGVYVVGSCGFDSIPADLGAMFLANQMGGDVNSVETYLEVDVPDLPGPCINYATYQSAIYGFAHAEELKPIRKKLFPERLPSTSPKLPPRGNLHASNIVKGYCLPFPGSDRSVMMRTQRALYAESPETTRPTQIGCYMKVSSWFSAVKIMIVGFIFGLLAGRKFGRVLLEKFPGFFTFGGVTKEGPSKEMAANTNFKVTLIGKGWNDKNKSRKHEKPEKEVKVTVSGKNIGYGSTSELVVQSALTILLEKDLMPGKGGVFTPGYAFRKTTLTQRPTVWEVV